MTPGQPVPVAVPQSPEASDPAPSLPETSVHEALPAAAESAPSDATPSEAESVQPTQAPALAPSSTEVAAEDVEAESLELNVTVLGARSDRAPGSVHVIGQRELRRFRRDDPNAVLIQAPGVTIRQEDGVGLRPNIGIRGVNADRSKKLTLMEDGVLFGPAPYSAPAAYYFPLMARMVQVRVIKGPSAIGYGPQTVGGAIDFITRPIPSKTSGAVDAGLGQYGYNKVHAYFGTSTDQFGMLIEGVRLNDSGFKHLPDESDTGSTRNDWMVKAAYEPFPYAELRNRFELKLSYADEVSNETYLGLTDADFRADPNRRYAASALDQMKNHRRGIVVSHELGGDGAGFKLRTDAYRFDYERTWRKVNAFRGTAIASVLQDPQDPVNAEYYAVLTGQADTTTAANTLLVGPNDRTFVNQGVQSKLEVSFGAETGVSHALEAGLRLHNDTIERRHSQNGFEMTDGILIPEDAGEEVTSLEDAQTFAAALSISDAITWRRLTVSPGVRAELLWTNADDGLAGSSSPRNVQALMPGLGVYYGITDTLGVLGGVYRGFSPPAPGSDKHVGPEYSINYELGARFTSAPLRADVIGFYNDYSNMTDVCTLASGCLTDDLDRQFDAGEARVYGLEASAAHELSAGPVRIPLNVSYTFTQTEFLNTFVSGDPIYGAVEKGDEMPYIPKHQLVGSLGVEGERAGGAASVGVVSPTREQAGSGPLGSDAVLTTDQQLWIDLSANFTVIDGFSLWANLRNLLDNQVLVSRRPYGARPNAPRWFSAGARLEF
jgi:Fe(3+) dicitrate transport protein